MLVYLSHKINKHKYMSEFLIQGHRYQSALSLLKICCTFYIFLCFLSNLVPTASLNRPNMSINLLLFYFEINPFSKKL